jgi:hypothetical protein
MDKENRQLTVIIHPGSSETAGNQGMKPERETNSRRTMIN